MVRVRTWDKSYMLGDEPNNSLRADNPHWTIRRAIKQTFNGGTVTHQ